MSYENLSDEDKIITAIGFVARGVTMPEHLKQFLESENLYTAITQPMEIDDIDTGSDSTGRRETGLPGETG